MQDRVELTKSLAWPAFAAILLISFWKPLHALADEVPALIWNAEEISVGGVTLHLQESLFERMSDKQKDILADLQPDEIAIVLTFAPGNVLCWPQLPPPAERRPYDELVKLGLFRSATNEEVKDQESQHYGCEYGLSTTAEFESIRKLLIGGVTDAIRRAAMAPRSKPVAVVMKQGDGR